MTDVTDPSGSTSYVYDALGDIVQETQVIGGTQYVTSYGYDLSGHVMSITYPSGRIVTYTRDAMGRIASVATQANAGATPVTLASSISYEPFGPLTSLTYGNGLALNVTYNEDYQPTARVVSSATATVQNLGYTFIAAGVSIGVEF